MDNRFWLWAGIGVAAAFGFFALRRYLSEAHEGPLDEVDIASEGSFPASDAPSWTPVHGVGRFEENQ